MRWRQLCHLKRFHPPCRKGRNQPQSGRTSSRVTFIVPTLDRTYDTFYQLTSSVENCRHKLTVHQIIAEQLTDNKYIFTLLRLQNKISRRTRKKYVNKKNIVISHYRELINAVERFELSQSVSDRREISVIRLNKCDSVRDFVFYIERLSDFKGKVTLLDSINGPRELQLLSTRQSEDLRFSCEADLKFCHRSGQSEPELNVGPSRLLNDITKVSRYL